MLASTRSLEPRRQLTHHKYNAQFLDDGPLQRVLVALVRRVRRGGLRALGGSGGGLLFYEYIRDEVVDNGRANRGIGPRPQYHPRGGQYRKGVQHRGAFVFDDRLVIGRKYDVMEAAASGKLP